MKKLTRKPVHFKGLTLGLDLHKKFIEWCLLDRRGNERDKGRIGSERGELAKLQRERMTLKKVNSLSFQFDSVGYDPFDIWIDGLAIE